MRQTSGRRRRGFTLVEVTISISLLAIGTLGAVTMFMANQESQRDSDLVWSATEDLNSVVEMVQGITYGSLPNVFPQNCTNGVVYVGACATSTQAYTPKQWGFYTGSLPTVTTTGGGVCPLLQSLASLYRLNPKALESIQVNYYAAPLFAPTTGAPSLTNPNLMGEGSPSGTGPGLLTATQLSSTNLPASMEIQVLVQWLDRNTGIDTPTVQPSKRWMEARFVRQNVPN
jgi:prepilin-type N-terminal cleavage/methylation domain-containing protein